MPNFFDPRSFERPRRLLTIGAALMSLLVSDLASAKDMTLADALKRAAAHDLTAPASTARVQAAEASLRQAEVGPRPVIGVDLEDFAGTGPYSPVDRSQSTFFYERTLERGGKREARKNAARFDLTVTESQGRLRSLDLLAHVQSAWVEAQALQASVAVAEERLAITEQLERQVARRVERALDPLFSGERARTAVLQTRIARDQAIEAARIARMTLASWWNGNPDFQLDPAAFERLDVKPVEIENAPDLALLTSQRDAADSRIRLEKARSVADPTVRAGLRHFGDGNEVALVIGGSIPLGGGQANRGNVDRAQAELVAAEAEISFSQIDLNRETARLNASRAAIAEEIRRIDAEVLPGAKHALALVLEGFNRGGGAFTYLEVTEQQRIVIEARMRRIDLLRRFYLDGARLDRLSGRHLPLIARVENR